MRGDVISVGVQQLVFIDGPGSHLSSIHTRHEQFCERVGAEIHVFQSFGTTYNAPQILNSDAGIGRKAHECNESLVL